MPIINRAACSKRSIEPATKPSSISRRTPWPIASVMAAVKTSAIAAAINVPLYGSRNLISCANTELLDLLVIVFCHCIYSSVGKLSSVVNKCLDVFLAFLIAYAATDLSKTQLDLSLMKEFT